MGNNMKKPKIVSRLGDLFIRIIKGKKPYYCNECEHYNDLKFNHNETCLKSVKWYEKQDCAYHDYEIKGNMVEKEEYLNFSSNKNGDCKYYLPWFKAPRILMIISILLVVLSEITQSIFLGGIAIIMIVILFTVTIALFLSRR
jgi:hypothetical protein